MARLVRGCQMPWSQQEGTGEPETNVSVPQQVGQADTARGKDIVDYILDLDYKPDGSDPDIKAVNKEEGNSDAVQNWSYLEA